jgi:threonine dehydrogenase-like Zn-dependent dehydrogenase
VRAAIFNEPRSITAGDRPDAAIREPSDAVVRVVLACVCGSDLWYYRGDSPFEPGPIGHEFIGVIEDVGADVTTLREGDLVISPFAFSDGTCPNCQNGITTACMNGGFYPMNGDGGQGEAVRVPLADTTLVVVPGSAHSDEMMRSLLRLSDVFATGHHAAVCAQLTPVTPSPSSAMAPSASPAFWLPSASEPRGSSPSRANPIVRPLVRSSAPPTSSPSEARKPSPRSRR